VEERAGAYIEKDADHKKQSGGDPGTERRIYRHVVPRAGQSPDADPHGDPRRNQDTKWGTHARTPSVRARMHHQPERRDGGIKNTSQPTQRVNELHEFILACVGADAFVRPATGARRAAAWTSSTSRRSA